MAELSHLTWAYVPALTPAEIMTALSFLTAQVALNSTASTSREKLIDDISIVVGGLYDTMVEEFQEQQHAQKPH